MDRDILIKFSKDRNWLLWLAAVDIGLERIEPGGTLSVGEGSNLVFERPRLS